MSFILNHKVMDDCDIFVGVQIIPHIEVLSPGTKIHYLKKTRIKTAIKDIICIYNNDHQEKCTIKHRIKGHKLIFEKPLPCTTLINYSVMDNAMFIKHKEPIEYPTLHKIVGFFKLDDGSVIKGEWNAKTNTLTTDDVRFKNANAVDVVDVKIENIEYYLIINGNKIKTVYIPLNRDWRLL